MSVGTELIAQIERISAKRERLRNYAKDSAANFAPTIFMMTAEIEEAKAALVSDDPVRAIRAYEALKDYSDDD